MTGSDLPRSGSAAGGETAQDARTAEVEVADGQLLMALAGPGSARLLRLEQSLGIGVGLRGATIRLHGPADRVALGERVLAELLDVLQSGGTLRDDEIGTSVRLLSTYPDLRLREVFRDVVIGAEGGRQVVPRGMAQKLYVQAIRQQDLVFGVGPAGTGKTYLAMAMAVASLREQRINRIILTRPAVEAGEKLGFLPGDLAEKVNPYLRPLYDALYDMMPGERAHTLLQRGTIEVAPLAFMRGRTLNDSFVILDEAQNTTIAQMKMFLTRIGQHSKAVITGDVTQVDLPAGTGSGLDDALRLLADVPGVARRYFGAEDVVRHPLVQRIVEAYDARDDARARGKRKNDGG
jgi:phosphate starvation-inducible PhoH-like protein